MEFLVTSVFYYCRQSGQVIKWPGTLLLYWKVTIFNFVKHVSGSIFLKKYLAAIILISHIAYTLTLPAMVSKIFQHSNIKKFLTGFFLKAIHTLCLQLNSSMGWVFQTPWNTLVWSTVEVQKYFSVNQQNMRYRNKKEKWFFC